MKKRIVSLLSLCLLMIPQLHAQKEFKTESISIFKNNTAFYIKSGALSDLKEGKHTIKDSFPKALFGTFWFFSPNTRLKSVSSFVTEVEQEIQASTIQDMLLSNQGKLITLLLTNGRSETGKLNYVSASLSPSDAFATLEKNDGTWLTFKTKDVLEIRYKQKPIMSYQAPSEKHVIQLDFGMAKSVEKLEMMYLQRGLGWLPNYLVELKSDNKATLTLRAEVTNDAEDIVNTTINFVVGVPNFRYANKPTSLIDFLGNAGAIANGNFNNFANSLRVQRRSYEFEGFEDDEDGLFGGLGNGIDDVGTSSAEDLFFYSIKNVSLKKGGRAYYDVLKTDLDIEHIYESYLSSNHTSAKYYQKTYSFTEDRSSKIYHSIKMSNKSASPWTTGSAMVIQVDKDGKKPISQDLLQYTPRAGSTFLKLTETTDIRIKHAEKETDRENRKFKARDGYFYDLIQVEAQIKIKNHKTKTVRLDIKRDITGEAKKSDEKWLTSERVNLNSKANKTTQVCWELELKPGEEKVITYTYQVYAR